MAQLIAGTFTATGASQAKSPKGLVAFNISVWGNFVGTVVVERSFDKGSTWLPKWPDAVYSMSAPQSFTDSEPENGVQYRLNCTSYTSGTINYRVSQ